MARLLMAGHFIGTFRPRELIHNFPESRMDEKTKRKTPIPARAIPQFMLRHLNYWRELVWTDRAASP
jgi:hypothetical protein